MLSAETGQDLEGPLAGRLIALGIWRRRWRRRCNRVGCLWRVELNSADIQILFEAVELQEVGKFESSDIPASLADLSLEIADDSLHIGLVEPGVEELIPEPFPINELFGNAVGLSSHAIRGQQSNKIVRIRSRAICRSPTYRLCDPICGPAYDIF